MENSSKRIPVQIAGTDIQKIEHRAAWITWNGDGFEPPVDKDVMVDLLDRDLFEWHNVRAGSHPWFHLGTDQDIVAYRLAAIESGKGGAQ